MSTESRHIPDCAKLWRRLHKSWILDDGTLSSLAFREGFAPHQPSVHWSELTSLQQVRGFLRRDQLSRLGEVAAAVVRRFEHEPTHRPTCEDPSHSVLIPSPDLSSGAIRKSAHSIAKAARILDLR